MALKMHKHVHCQKPLTHSVYEARMIGRAAAEAKVGTQMGNFGQASEEARLICETIWSGALGTVREVHAGSNRIPMISQRGCARPGRPAARARLARLGPVGRPGADAALPSLLPSLLLARLVGLRHRLPGRHRLPPVLGRVQGPQARASRLGRGQLVEPSLWTGSGQRDRAAGLDHALALPRRWRPRGGHAHLVGRRAEAASARGMGSPIASLPTATG